MIYRSCIKGQETDNRCSLTDKRKVCRALLRRKNMLPSDQSIGSSIPFGWPMRRYPKWLNSTSSQETQPCGTKVASEKGAHATMWQMWSRLSCLMWWPSYLLPNTHPKLYSYINTHISIFFFSIRYLNSRKVVTQFSTGVENSLSVRECRPQLYSFFFFCASCSSRLFPLNQMASCSSLCLHADSSSSWIRQCELLNFSSSTCCVSPVRRRMISPQMESVTASWEHSRMGFPLADLLALTANSRGISSDSRHQEKQGCCGFQQDSGKCLGADHSPIYKC